VTRVGGGNQLTKSGRARRSPLSLLGEASADSAFTEQVTKEHAHVEQRGFAGAVCAHEHAELSQLDVKLVEAAIPCRFDARKSRTWLFVLGAELTVRVRDKRKVIVEDLLLATQPPFDEVAVGADTLDLFDVFENLLSVRAPFVERIASPIESDLLCDSHKYESSASKVRITWDARNGRFP